MKNLAYSILGFLLLFACQTKAQNLIAVQNGGTPKFYEKLEDAISNAVAKDTIYISGGVFQNIPANTLTIDKELHLIGAGHHPDSTRVTNPTYIEASIFVISGANKSSFEGLYLTGGLYAGPSQVDDVDDITISRCNISEIYLSGLSNSWSIHENIIARGSNIGNYPSDSPPYAQNNLFSNNIIGSIDNFGSGNQFRNNIIYRHGENFVTCFFENNLFFSWFTFAGRTLLCTFNNNLTDRTSTYIPDGNFGSNNITDFTDQGGQFGHTFSYAYDYHLQPTSLGKNAGKDGTDIGIYGGLYPWKAGSVPSNPHIQAKQVAGTTDPSGNLHVKIKVAAQDN